MINWKLDQVTEGIGLLTLYDCTSGARFLIRFTDPNLLRQMLGDIIVGSRTFDMVDEPDPTPFPDYMKHAFPELSNGE